MKLGNSGEILKANLRKFISDLINVTASENSIRHEQLTLDDLICFSSHLIDSKYSKAVNSNLITSMNSARVTESVGMIK